MLSCSTPCLCAGCDNHPTTIHDYASPFSVEQLDQAGFEQGSAVAFEVRDDSGQAIPFALLTLDWADGGRLAFQADGLGRIEMKLGEFPAREEVTIWAAVKQRGQDLLQGTYEETTKTLMGGQICAQRAP